MAGGGARSARPPRRRLLFHRIGFGDDSTQPVRASSTARTRHQFLPSRAVSLRDLKTAHWRVSLEGRGTSAEANVPLSESRELSLDMAIFSTAERARISGSPPKYLQVFVCALGSGWFSCGLTSPIAEARFLRYWLNSPVMVSHIPGHRDGTVAGAVESPDDSWLPVAVPPLAEQRHSPPILGTLDDKIELNRRTNETLEAMARALLQVVVRGLRPRPRQGRRTRPRSAQRHRGTLPRPPRGF